MHLRRLGLVLASAALFAAGSGACSHTDALTFDPTDASGGAFSLEGGADTSPVDSGLVDYCPALHCPYPWTTCPGSQFPCDINVLEDPNNCGGCQVACPFVFTGADFACSAGRCIAQCTQGYADCNALPDDGCEAQLGSNFNCNACGDACPDPAKPCIYDSTMQRGQCGCAPGLVLCSDNQCHDPQSEDSNCGACDVACDPAGDGGKLAANEYLGCAAGKCGAVKCDQGFADCDKVAANGCEASIATTDNCGMCGIKCSPGQTCGQDTKGRTVCLCPPGQTLCGGVCSDILSDLYNCGGCGNDCTLASVNKNGIGLCKYGSCEFKCGEGFGDCNGDPSDGCEVNLSSDQSNCGACGHECDIYGGQPCIIGQCAVEPCAEGGVPR